MLAADESPLVLEGTWDRAKVVLLSFPDEIYLIEGSLLVVVLWLLPMLVFANQATLFYFALHYDSIVAKVGAGLV